MLLKTDARFKEKPICSFKNNNNEVNFDPGSQKSKTFALRLVPFVQSV